MFFTGDFNAHAQTWYPNGDTNAEGTLLDELFTKLNLSQLISEPTHFFRNDCIPSCIDLIISDQPNLVLDSGVRPSLDTTVKHQMIYCKINYKIPPLPKFNRKIWHFDRAKKHLITRAVSEFPWLFHLSMKNPTQQVKILTENLLKIMSNFIPNEEKKISPRDPEWLNRHVKNLLKRQNKQYKKFRKNGYNNADKILLDQLKQECSYAIQSAKEKFLKDQGSRLSNPTTGQKTYWKILNRFLNKCKIPRIPPLFINNKYITDCKEKASIFNGFFASQCTPLDNGSVLPAFHYNTHSRLTDFNITTTEINDVLDGLNVKKAHGPDKLSANMIKLCGHHLSLPLQIIFENILDTGIFPDQWKEANVTPVHKKNDKQIITNYRPISLLPILGKVFERIVFKNLYNYLNSNNLITKKQSGFIPGDSCTNQLLSLVHEIHAAFDDKKCLEVRSVFLDMSKAFDKVWHKGLIFKLKQNGVDGKLLNFFTNYLSNRKQRVVINGKESTWAAVRAGVPQGSVLGPLLFLIYVNDLENGIKSKIKFFADDTSLFSVVHDPATSASDLNHDLTLISSWANQWKMSFNPDPTKPAEEVLFSHKKVKVVHPHLSFNGIEVKRVGEHKHLGLILDSKLTFVKHINEKLSIAKKWIGIIRHLSPYLPLKSLDQIYKMHIRPHLDYCDIIFHTPNIIHDDFSLTLRQQMDVLERTQYQAALAVSGAWQGTNTDKIYEQLGWESLTHRRFFHRVVMMYKIVNHLTPDYLRHPIPSLQNRYVLRSANNVHTLPWRNARFQNSFYPDSIKSWNNLGPILTCDKSLSIFKRSILQLIKPVKKDTFNIHDRTGISWIFQLRVGLSPLYSHKMEHNFMDTRVDTCLCKIGPETTSHFLLECPLFSTHRLELLQLVHSILFLNDLDENNVNLVHTLLYGHEKISVMENMTILEAVIEFIRKSGRFSRV